MDPSNWGTQCMTHTPIFPALHSMLAASALEEHVLSAYPLGTVCACHLFYPGINDTYVVRTQGQQYILRVYRYGLHAYEHILFEIDALRHLSQKGIPVAAPVAMHNGSFVTTLNAAEGERHVVLFQYAPGGRFSRPCVANEIYVYGRTVAQIHNGWDDFQSTHLGHQFSLAHFLDQPLVTFLPLLARRPDDSRFLLELSADLKRRFALIPPEGLAYGVCHGDLHGGNANITADHVVTFYDFEFVGVGWQVIDLAAFCWAIQRYHQNGIFWEIFLEGYTSLRSINALDLKMVPLFILLRHLFLMGLHSCYLDVWGETVINDSYLDFHLAFIRSCADVL